MAAPGHITELLHEINSGNPQAMSELSGLVYQQLRVLARVRMREERASHTLQATALVHETYIRLLQVTNPTWKNRAHFFGAAAEAMRRILVDSARARKSRKRDRGEIALAELDDVVGREFVDYVALDIALDRLKAFDDRRSRVVELRFFAGLSIEEIAELLDVSDRTVKRDWEYARVWLYRELSKD
jgi:RNA polymerase sigma-70 factor, ECF subfamily